MWTRLLIVLCCVLALLAPRIPKSLADDAPPAPEGVVALVQLLGQVDDAAFQLDLLKGVNEGLKGLRRVQPPKQWAAVYAKLSKSKSAEVRGQAQKLALLFGDAGALESIRKVLMDPKADPAERQQALTSLVEKKDAQLPPLLHKLIAKAGTYGVVMRGPTIRALAAYEDPDAPAVVLKAYPALDVSERRDAINMLASRLAYAKALMAAVRTKEVPAGHVNAEVIRQLRAYDDADLKKMIDATWAVVRRTPKEKEERIAQIKALLGSKDIGTPDPSHGRGLFANTCMQCHTLFGVGGKVGPDLTGSNRANLDYLLYNAVDPNAQIGTDYQTTQVVTKDGQNVMGIVVAETDRAVTLRTATNDVLIPKGEIDTRRVHAMSMMPEGLLDRFKPDELRDWAAYLASPGQVPLPPGFKLQPTAAPTTTKVEDDPFK
jgi:putative heme-binding domain-containing protein